MGFLSIANTEGLEQSYQSCLEFATNYVICQAGLEDGERKWFVLQYQSLKSKTLTTLLNQHEAEIDNPFEPVIESLHLCVFKGGFYFHDPESVMLLDDLYHPPLERMWSHMRADQLKLPPTDTAEPSLFGVENPTIEKRRPRTSWWRKFF